MMKHNKVLFICCALLSTLFLAHCGDSPTSSTDPKDDPQRAWMTPADPESLGFSAARLAEARTFSEQIGSAAVLVLYDGHIIAEWGQTEHKYLAHSIRKSLLGALYGIYVEEGAIDLNKTLAELGIDDAPVALTDGEKQARIIDLLKARSGIYIPSASQSEAARAALPERGSQSRDTHFYYNNWDFNALGTIFEQETGKGIFAEFAMRIAAPLEMEHFAEDDGLYYFEREYSTHPAYHFEISARDLARFGLLYLRDGTWQGEQIVPASWVAASTTPYSASSETTGYGYLWWTITDGSYAALGYGGHWVHVIPDEKLVIVHRTDTDNEQTVSTPDYIALQTMIREARNETVPNQTPTDD